MISYGLGGFAITLNSMFIASFGQFFMTDYMGMGAATAGTLMMLITLFDAVNDPIIGGLADRNHSKRGKYRPYMLFGGLGLCLVSVLRFVDVGLQGAGLIAYFLIVMMGWSVSFTAFCMPWQAMNAVMSKDVKQRNRLLTSRQLLGFVSAMIGGSVTLPLVNAFGGGKTGYLLTAIVYSVIMAVCFFCTDRGAKRTDQPGMIPDPPKMNLKEQLGIIFKNKIVIFAALVFGSYSLSYGIINISNMYYFTHVVKNESLMSTTSFAGLVGTLLVVSLMTRLIEKFGKKPMIAFGMLVMSARPAAVMLLGSNISATWVFILSVVSIVGGGIANFTTLSLIPDAIDSTELKFGSANAGFINASVTFMQKFAGAFASFLPGVVLELAGYNAATAATPQVVNAILSVTGWMPLLVAALGIVALVFYPLGKTAHADMLLQLAEKRGAVAPAPQA